MERHEDQSVLCIAIKVEPDTDREGRDLEVSLCVQNTGQSLLTTVHNTSPSPRMLSDLPIYYSSFLSLSLNAATTMFQYLGSFILTVEIYLQIFRYCMPFVKYIPVTQPHLLFPSSEMSHRYGGIMGLHANRSRACTVYA